MHKVLRIGTINENGNGRRTSVYFKVEDKPYGLSFTGVIGRAGAATPKAVVGRSSWSLPTATRTTTTSVFPRLSGRKMFARAGMGR